jgi:ribose transport system permease protein
MNSVDEKTQTKHSKFDGKEYFRRLRALLRFDKERRAVIAKRLIEGVKSTPLSAIALLILFLIFSPLTSFQTISGTNLSNIGRQSSVLLLAATGGTFAILLGGIDLSVGSVMSMSGVVAAVLVVSGYDPFLSILVAAAVGFAFGTINGIIIARLRVPPIITTLAMMFVVSGSILAFTHGYPITGISEATTLFHTISAGNTFGIPNVFLLALAFWFLSYIILRRTVLGRNIYAVGGNREAARIAGISVIKTEITAYALAGLFNGLAGVLLMARLASGHPTMGESYLLDAIAAVFVGGTSAAGGLGGVVETLVGALIVTTLNNGMQMLSIDPFLITLVKGILILVALVIVITRTKKD